MSQQHDLNGAQSGMQDLGIHGTNATRKKKTRHVLDSSLQAPASNGFTQGQWVPPVGAQPDALSPAHNLDAKVKAAPVHHGNLPAHSPRMDTDEIPHLSDDAADVAAHYRKHAFYTNQTGVYNPPANIDFYAIDAGVSNPKQARLSMGLISANSELAAAVNVPLSLVMQPLAPLRQEEDNMPYIDCVESGVPRCHRCRAYINPAMQFINGGAKFICNICGFPNETPAEYYSPCDINGQRQDLDLRPELQFGTCNFYVGKDYWPKDRPLRPMRVLFAIDVSEQSLIRGVPTSTCNAIQKLLYDDPIGLPEGLEIAIISFDRACHFYNLHADLTHTQMLAINDVEEMFVPMHDGLFANPIASRSIIEATLSTISTVFERESVPEPALGAVCKAAYIALKESGGKLCLFCGALPTWGPGKLKMRENTSLYNTPEERVLFDAQSIHWKNVGEEFATAGVGVDAFLFPASYIDVATIGTLPLLSGGNTYIYQNFLAERDSIKFETELASAVTQDQGFSAQMKVRCSTGISVSNMIGDFISRGSSDIEMGSIDKQKAITYVFSHDGKLDPQKGVHFQSALLYTNPTGVRILRTHNLHCPVSTNIGDILRSCDVGATIATIGKQAATDILKKDQKSVKSLITEQCVRILASYRKHCATHAPSSELILPESLKLLPLFALALQKQFAFRTDSVNSDTRIASVRQLRNSSVKDLLSIIYPRLIPIHSLSPEDGFPDETGQLVMPATAKNSFSQLDNGGAYILDNGQTMYIWFKSDVSPNLLEDLYGTGINTLEQLDPRSATLPVLETLLNVQVRNIIAYLNSMSTSRHLHPKIARQSLDGSEMIFAQALVEDRNCDAMSYVDFLVHIHRQVQVTLHQQSQSTSFSATRWIGGTE